MRDSKKTSHRFNEYKEISGKTFKELASLLGYEDLQYMYKFSSGERAISKNAAEKLHNLSGWRTEYFLGLDDYRTDEDYYKRYLIVH